MLPGPAPDTNSSRLQLGTDQDGILKKCLEVGENVGSVTNYNSVTPHLLYIYIYIIFISTSIFIPWSTKLLFPPLVLYVSLVQCEYNVVLCKVLSYPRGVAGSGCCSRLALVRDNTRHGSSRAARRHSAAVETRALNEGPHEGS